MEYVDTGRYWLGVAISVSILPAILYWIIIHSTAPYLRAFSPPLVLGIMISLLFLGILNLLPYRNILMSSDLGNAPLLWVLASPLLWYAWKLDKAARKYLTWRTLIGVPEFNKDEAPVLLCEGIYARVRHPRYASLLLAMIAYALFINHTGFYGVLALTIIGFLVITWLEERELRARFGHEYVEYASEVPRLIPRI